MNNNKHHHAVLYDILFEHPIQNSYCFYLFFYLHFLLINSYSCIKVYFYTVCHELDLNVHVKPLIPVAYYFLSSYNSF